ncbi:MAG: hypothetical protein QNK37_10705 [Acidobacteriota bacterium]|nr:hypothetical protein [Acidobacteriota bacterium]
MPSGVFVIAIVAISGWIAISILNIVFKKGLPRTQEDQARIHQLEAQIADLNRRLSNVETITTSRDFQLNREFEELSR